MLEKIDLHEPFVMAAQLKSQRDKFKNGKPEEVDMAKKLSDEAIDLSARSAYFFKVAARELTLRQLAMAQSRFLYLVLVADTNQLDQACATAIAKAKACTGAETALVQLFPALANGDQSTLRADVSPLGWSWAPTKSGDLYASDPDFVLKVVRNRLVNPDTQKTIDEATAELNKLNVPLPNNLATLSPADQATTLKNLRGPARTAAVNNAAPALGLDVTRTADLQNLQQKLQALDAGDLKTRVDQTGAERNRADNDRKAATANNKDQLEAEFQRLDKIFDDARKAYSKAKEPLTQQVDRVNAEINRDRALVRNYVEWGGDDAVRSQGKNPNNLSPQQKLKACEDGMNAEVQRLGGDNELKEAAKYGRFARNTVREKLDALRVWVEYRDTALRNNATYKVGVPPNPVGELLLNLMKFQQAEARVALDQAH
jgi:hypothetical protein